MKVGVYLNGVLSESESESECHSKMDEKVFANPPKGDTQISGYPWWREMLDNIKRVGQEGYPGVELGMLPVGSRGITGPNILENESIRALFSVMSRHPAMKGGVAGQLQKTPGIYSVQQRAVEGDPSTYFAPLSDMDMKALLREMGSMNPVQEGALTERVTTTPQTRRGFSEELTDFLGMVTDPIFKMKRPIPPGGQP